MIEVIVSAVLVGIIVIATFTGFDVVNRVSADERFHNQAAVLAAESQEQLRSDPASALQTLESGHSYNQTIGGTTYTIVQQTELQPASGSNAACSVTENKRQSGNAFRITSTVTWPQQQKAKRVAVVDSSVVTPPTGSALEVDAGNDPTVTAGVAGITATAKYKPVGSSSVVTLEHTTGAGGCVVFGGIPSTEASVEIAELAGYFTRAGVAKYPTKTVSIAPNYTTHYPILYNRGGTIKAEFTYNASKEYSHAGNNGSGTVKEPVTGDTFVSFNPLMEAAPDYEVGSTRYATATTVYKPLPSGSPTTYEGAAESPGNLFPFATTEAPWSAYAGDCVANNPKEVTSGIVKPAESIFVTSGSITTALVPTSLVTLNLYTGTEAEVTAKVAGERWKLLETTSRPVTITNLKCAGTTPNNESTVSVTHKQETTSGTAELNAGHLGDPFLPFGTELELCVYRSPNAYTRKYEDKATIGPVLPIYLGQKSTQEKTAATNAAVAKENAEKTKWATERSKNEITSTQLTNKENVQTTERNARKAQETNEATEATNSKVTVETSAGCP